MKGKFTKDSLVNTKPMMSLIDPEFKESLARLMTLGGFKYEFHNWKLAEAADTQHYRDALERHLLARDKGEYVDEDTGMPHLICVAFNAMCLDYLDKKLKNYIPDLTQYNKKLKEYKELKDGKSTN